MAITKIVETNAGLLLGIRQAVNELHSDDVQLQREVVRYSTGIEGKHAFVFEQGCLVCGYIEMELVGKVFPACTPQIEGLEGFGHIVRIGVLKSERKRGVASALLRTAESCLKFYKVRGVWLDYLARNEPAMRLYVRNGYKDVVEFADIQGRARRITAKKL